MKNPLFFVLSIAGLGGLALLLLDEAQASTRQALTFNQTVDPITGEDVLTPAVVEVNPVGEQMSDAEYNALLRSRGYDPSAWGPPSLDNATGDLYESSNFTADFPAMLVDMEGSPMTKSPEQNIKAFLEVIGTLESNGDYQALVGGGRFSDFRDHPYNLGWPGAIVGGVRTAAAGKYQIQPATLAEVNRQRAARGLGPLPDFSPASQDIAAIEILSFPWRQGAILDVRAGKFDAAMRKLTLEWESFERVLAGNYPYSVTDARQIYAGNGGTFA